MAENLSNGAQTTITGGIDTDDTALTLTSANGWPEAPFRAALGPDANTITEIIYVGARSGTAVSSITRAAEPVADGTQAGQNHSAGAYITQVLTKGGLQTIGLATNTIGSKAYNSATQTINNTTAVVTMNSEEFDTDGFHSTLSATSRMTIPVGLAGKYLVEGGTFFSGSGVWVGIQKNGASTRGFQSVSGTAYVQVGTILDLVVGDYVELAATTSGNVTVGHGSLLDAQSWIALIKLDSGRAGTAIGAKVYYSTTFNPGGSYTSIPMDLEVYDTDGFHSNVTNNTRLTIPTGLGGKYLITLATGTHANGGYIVIKKNGTANFLAYQSGAGSVPSLALVTNLEAGEYVEAQSNGSGNLTVDGDTGFTITKLDSGNTQHTHTTVDATMGADVTMTTANTYYSGPSSVFDAGTWMIWHKVLIESSGSPVIQRSRIWNGSTIYDETEGFTTSSGYRTTLTGFALVTLTVATTITLQAAADTNSQTLKRDGSVGSTHTVTRLTGIKIA